MAYAIQRKSDGALMTVDYSEMWGPDGLCYYGNWTLEVVEDDYTEYNYSEDAYRDMWGLFSDNSRVYNDYEIVEV